MNSLTIPASEINSVIEIADSLALPEVQSLTNQTPAIQRHYRIKELAKLGRKAAIALRQEVVEMYLSGQYKTVQIPYANNPNEFISFGGVDDAQAFRGWLSYVIEDEAGLSETATSTLNTFIFNVVDPTAKKLLTKETGDAYEVDEILSLPEGNMQQLASASNRIRKNTELDEEEQLQQISDLVDLAKTMTTSEFTNELRQRNLSNRKVPASICQVAYNKEKKYYFIEVDTESAQDASISLGLQGRVNYEQVSLDDILSNLMADQITEEDVANAVSDEVTTNDVANWLNNNAEGTN